MAWPSSSLGLGARFESAVAGVFSACLRRYGTRSNASATSVRAAQGAQRLRQERGSVPLRQLLVMRRYSAAGFEVLACVSREP
jgi:hypothetical protein